MKRKTVDRILGFAGLAFTCAVAKTLFMSSPDRPKKEKRLPFEGRNIAHRGLHDEEIPENTIAAFEEAAENGYGVELDVHLTADRRVVVYHDDVLERLCGDTGNIHDMTWSELKRLRINGTEHRIPLLSEALNTINGRVPIVVELKRGPYNRELCEQTLTLLRCYDGPVCIESFDPFIVRWFRLNAPEILRGQLICSPRELRAAAPTVPSAAAFVVGSGLTSFISRPQFIAHSVERKSIFVMLTELLGAMRVCWTARDESHESGNDVVIFEGYRPQPVFK